MRVLGLAEEEEEQEGTTLASSSLAETTAPASVAEVEVGRERRDG